MKITLMATLRALLILLVTGCCACAKTVATKALNNDLVGTSWQLVRFQGSDGTTLTPDDGVKYTIAFHADGSLAVRIDCNRGRSSWKSAGPNQLEFGPLALTRAMCPPGSMHDRIVTHWPYFRSYVTKDGHLFLALMADGGIYEFQPLAASPKTPAKGQ